MVPWRFSGGTSPFAAHHLAVPALPHDTRPMETSPSGRDTRPSQGASDHPSMASSPPEVGEIAIPQLRDHPPQLPGHISKQRDHHPSVARSASPTASSPSPNPEITNPQPRDHHPNASSPSPNREITISEPRDHHPQTPRSPSPNPKITIPEPRDHHPQTPDLEPRSRLPLVDRQIPTPRSRSLPFPTDTSHPPDGHMCIHGRRCLTFTSAA